MGKTQNVAPDFLQWWASHEVDRRNSMIRDAFHDRERLLDLVRAAFNAGLAAAAPVAEMTDDEIVEIAQSGYGIRPENPLLGRREILAFARHIREGRHARPVAVTAADDCANCGGGWAIDKGNPCMCGNYRSTK